MNRVLTILITLLVVGGVCAALVWWLVLAPRTTPQNGTTGGGSQYPAGNNTTVVGGGGGDTTSSGSAQTGGTMTLPSMTGTVIKARDFLKDADVVPDPSNTGHYYLAGQYTVSNQHPPYTLVYIQADQSFQVSLNQEPVAQVRQQAEQDLLKRLGLSNKYLMCNLRYYVSVPTETNPIYAGKNLGFSFCPGATQL